MSKDPKWDDGLEGTAFDIASCEESPLRVLAGPGTGKTYAMKRRVMRLLQQEEAVPQAILACTFTRTAARDIAKEIAGLGVDGADRVGHAVRLALLERQVVAHSFFSEQALDGNPKDLEDCEAQQAYALLTLLADPEDRVALRCWCGFASGTLNEAGWRRLRTYCEENGGSPREALEQLVEKAIKIPHTGAIVERFKLLQAREVELEALTGHGLADALFPEGEEWTEALRPIVKQAFPEPKRNSPSLSFANRPTLSLLYCWRQTLQRRERFNRRGAPSERRELVSCNRRD